MLRAPLASFRDDLMRRRFFIDAMLSLLHSKVEFSLSHARFPIAAIFFLPHLHVSRIQQNVNCDPGQVDNIKYDAHRNTPLQPDTHTQIRVEWGGWKHSLSRSGPGYVPGEAQTRAVRWAQLLRTELAGRSCPQAPRLQTRAFLERIFRAAAVDD
jgi:hypothetical protein